MRKDSVDYVLHLGDYIYEYKNGEYGWGNSYGNPHPFFLWNYRWLMYPFFRPNSAARSADFHALRLSQEACSIPNRFGPSIKPQSIRMDHSLGT